MNERTMNDNQTATREMVPADELQCSRCEAYIGEHAPYIEQKGLFFCHECVLAKAKQMNAENAALTAENEALKTALGGLRKEAERLYHLHANDCCSCTDVMERLYHSEQFAQAAALDGRTAALTAEVEALKQQRDAYKEACEGYEHVIATKTEGPFAESVKEVTNGVIDHLTAEVQRLEAALRGILGWRETDLPEGDRAKRAIEHIEGIARAALGER